ncbi:MAG: hypothetical protein R3A48_08365 [Polyangiales bacterium]
MFCWGDNEFGMVGTTSALCERCENARCCRRPIRLPALRGVRDLAIGPASVCAVTADGALWCWGATNLPWTPGAAPTPRHIPSVIDAVSVRATATGWVIGRRDGTFLLSDPLARAIPPGARVAPGPSGFHVCSLTRDSEVRCDGANNFGQLGGQTTDAGSGRSSATLALRDLRALADGWRHSCALSHSGEVSCWGDNTDQALGALTGDRCPGVVGAADCVPSPRRIESIPRMRAIFAGGSVTWMIDEQSHLWVLDGGTFGTRGVATRYGWP